MTGLVRWIVVGLGLAMALGGIWALVTVRSNSDSTHVDIDAASRARLEQVLREERARPVEPQ